MGALDLDWATDRAREADVEINFHCGDPRSGRSFLRTALFAAGTKARVERVVPIEEAR